MSTSSRANASSEAAEIASLQKSKEDRYARWRICKVAFESKISKLRKSIEKMEQEIESLKSIAAAEAAVEAWNRGWTMWLLSPWYRKLELSEDDKACEDRARQERKMQKNVKERFLDVKRTALEQEERSFDKAKRDVELANSEDEGRIRMLAAARFARSMNEAIAIARAERMEMLRKERAAEALMQQRPPKDGSEKSSRKN